MAETLKLAIIDLSSSDSISTAKSIRQVSSLSSPLLFSFHFHFHSIPLQFSIFVDSVFPQALSTLFGWQKQNNAEMKNEFSVTSISNFPKQILNNKLIRGFRFCLSKQIYEKNTCMPYSGEGISRNKMILCFWGSTFGPPLSFPLRGTSSTTVWAWRKYLKAKCYSSYRTSVF